MRVIVTYSGGKDSQASLLWTIKHLTKTPTVVFCDTGWEHPLTYKHVRETTEALGLELVVLKSKKYGGMVDLATQKKEVAVVAASILYFRIKNDSDDRLHTRRCER